MSGFFDAWNALADGWLAWLGERSVAAAIVLLVVGAGIAVGRRRLSAHAPSYLLLLPVLMLVLPIERALPTGWPEAMPAAVAAALPRPAAEPDAAGELARSAGPDAASGAATDVHAPSTAADPRAVAAHTRPDLVACAFAGWLAVLVVGVAGLLLAQLRSDRELRRTARPPSADLLALFERLCSERGFDGRIELGVVAGLASPIATGVLRRAVYLPPALDAGLSETQLRFVLLHELEHHARRDVLVEGLLRCVRFAFWFHPIVWIVIAAHRRWREFACDEAAVARSGTNRRAPVADALLTLIVLANDAPRPRFAFASFSPSTPLMKTRMHRILDRSRSPRRSLSAIGLLVVSAMGLGALTVARAQQPEPTPRPQPPVTVEVELPGAAATAPAPKPDGEVAIAVDQGLAWLLANQQADGSWDIGPDPRKNYPRDHNRAHVTGLALRALLHGWKGPRHVDIVAAVERGDDFLRSAQNANGLFGGGEPMTEHYGHAQVLRALAAIQRVIPEQERLAAIARGIEYAERVRNPYSGWRYRPRDGDNDSKHTALMLLAFRDAADLGIEVPHEPLVHARELLDQLTDENTGRTGFVRAGEPMSRFVAKVKRFPKRFSEEPTAMRILVEQAFADDHGDATVLARAADLVRAMPPRWDPQASTIDYAYWCFGARAMAAVGGAHATVWRQCLHDALLQSRVVDGKLAHWPADDAWSRDGMEVYSTASAVLALCALP